MKKDNPGNPTVQKISLWLLRLLMRLLLRLEITNPENIPAAGPIIVIINHIALLDPFMVFGSFPRLVIPMAKKEVFDYFLLGPIFKIYGAIPVHRGEADIKAIKSALQILNNDGIVLLAPEGTRSPTYQLQAGKQGAAMIASRSGAAIVPVGVTGTHRIKANWLKLKRPPVRLSVGKAFRLRLPARGRNRHAAMDAITHELMYRLAAQLPAEFRGVYHNLEEATDSYLRSLADEELRKT